VVTWQSGTEQCGHQAGVGASWRRCTRRLNKVGMSQQLAQTASCRRCYLQSTQWQRARLRGPQQLCTHTKALHGSWQDMATRQVALLCTACTAGRTMPLGIHCLGMSVQTRAKEGGHALSSTQAVLSSSVWWMGHLRGQVLCALCSRAGHSRDGRSPSSISVLPMHAAMRPSPFFTESHMPLISPHLSGRATGGQGDTANGGLKSSF
jgi:hypothetical protein